MSQLSWQEIEEKLERGESLAGADLYDANLIGANLSGVDLWGADLRGANLSMADLSKASLRDANLSMADLSRAKLCRTDLSRVKLYGTDLRWANLRGATLREVDLSKARLGDTKFREEDLAGVKYRPEQLKQMIIERPEREPLIIIPDQRGRLTIRLTNENPPLLHLIYLAVFLEYQYDILYLFLFSQYDNLDKLQDILSGSPFHWLKDKEEAVKIVRISTRSPLEIELAGLHPVWLTIASFIAFYAVSPKEVKNDLYKCLRQAIYKTRKEKREEELLRADVLNKNADLLKKCRDIGVAPTDLLPPDEKKEFLPPALQDQEPTKLSRLIEQHKGDLSTRLPRIDCLKTILLLRQEGLLTNKLGDQELANLLEILAERFGREYQSLSSQTGLEVELEEEKKEK